MVGVKLTALVGEGLIATSGASHRAVFLRHKLVQILKHCGSRSRTRMHFFYSCPSRSLSSVPLLLIDAPLPACHFFETMSRASSPVSACGCTARTDFCLTSWSGRRRGRTPGPRERCMKPSLVTRRAHPAGAHQRKAAASCRPISPVSAFSTAAFWHLEVHMFGRFNAPGRSSCLQAGPAKYRRVVL